MTGPENGDVPDSEAGEDDDAYRVPALGTVETKHLTGHPEDLHAEVNRPSADQRQRYVALNLIAEDDEDLTLAILTQLSPDQADDLACDLIEAAGLAREGKDAEQ